MTEQTPEYIEQVFSMSGREAAERFGCDLPWNRRVCVTEHYEPACDGEFAPLYHTESKTCFALRSRLIDTEN